jgi:hypothetical protein
LGEGSSGTGGARVNNNGSNATAGSGGTVGIRPTATAGQAIAGRYGGGPGAQGGGGTAYNGSVGAVRIIWPGTLRLFPSTDTGDL